MTTLTGPLVANQKLPALELVSPAGLLTTWADVRPGSASIVYFMRTSTCAVCHQHLRELGALRIDGSSAAARVIVVVPGGAVEAAAVEKRHPALAGRVFASADAHATVGLFSIMGIQRSGTYVVEPDGRIVYAKTAAIPVGSFHKGETVAALSDGLPR